MSYIKIWIHLVWATKDRYPFLVKEIRQKIFFHIKENAQMKAIHIDHINGFTDHVHCLISLNADQSISKVANLIKGESSFWINKNNITSDNFAWQNEYFAASVSHSQIEIVRQYIRNQEVYHQKKSFEEEYNALRKKINLID